MIRLSDADVYELPVMLSLLKILSIRPPDQNAFSDAAINYRVEGEHIYFDRIDFHGDAISLRGKGEMDFQSEIALDVLRHGGPRRIGHALGQAGLPRRQRATHADPRRRHPAKPEDPQRGPARPSTRRICNTLRRQNCRRGRRRAWIGAIVRWLGHRLS